MKKLSSKLIAFFLISLVAGYAVSYGFMNLMNAQMRFYGGFLHFVAFLVAVILVIAFDKMFELGLYDWPEEEEKPEEPVKRVQATSIADIEGDGSATIPGSKRIPGAFFPHEIPTEHWDVDFGNSKEVYEGSELPLWVLAGWAAFILWAVVYLVIGLPGSF